MPGKINPVIPEVMSQVSFNIIEALANGVNTLRENFINQNKEMEKR